MDVMEMEPTEGDFSLRNHLLDLDIQQMDVLEKEQNANLFMKVIHSMWKRRRDKIDARPESLRTS